MTEESVKEVSDKFGNWVNVLENRLKKLYDDDKKMNRQINHFKAQAKYYQRHPLLTLLLCERVIS